MAKSIFKMKQTVSSAAVKWYMKISVISQSDRVMRPADAIMVFAMVRDKDVIFPHPLSQPLKILSADLLEARGPWIKTPLVQ